ncbi:MAG: tetratricopeptide repeat protein [Myxococcota bacterium]
MSINEVHAEHEGTRDGDRPTAPGDKWWSRSSVRDRGIVVQGLFPERFEEQASQIEERCQREGRILLVWDGSTSTPLDEGLFKVMREYVAEAERRHLLDSATQELWNWMSDRGREGEDQMSASCKQLRGACGRLWTRLAQALPATLVVVEPENLGRAEIDELSALLRHVLIDPADALAPEVDRDWRGNKIVLLSRDALPESLAALELPICRVDDDESTEQVMDFLGRSEILERIQRATGGSVSKLQTFIEELPDNVHGLLLHRFRNLSLDAQFVLRVLAVASEPMPLELLDDALAGLDFTEGLSAVLRSIVQGDYAERSIDGGTVRLVVCDQRFAAALRDELEPSELRRIHLALADAALGQNTEECRWVAARHFFAADAWDKGWPIALSVAETAVSNARGEQARDILEAMLDVADADRDLQPVLRMSFLLEEQQQNYREALAMCQRLIDYVDDPRDRAEALVNAGELEIRQGNFEGALDTFSQAREVLPAGSNAPTLNIRTILGDAEAYYLAGEHETAADAAHEVLEQVESANSLDEVDQRTIERAALKAHNLLGKVAIYREDYDEAADYFDSVRRTAVEWGWRSEVCRADGNLGIIEMQKGANDAALRYLRRAASQADTAPDVDRAGILLNLAMLEQRQGLFEDALERYLDVVGHSRRMGSTGVYYAGAYNLATLYQDIGAFEQALRTLRHIEEEPHGPLPIKFAIFAGIARAAIYFEQQRYADAIRTYRRVLDAYDGVETVSFYGRKRRLQMALCEVELGRDQRAEAIAEAVEAREQNSGLDALLWAAIYAARHRWEEAEACARRALASLRGSTNHHAATRSSVLLCDALIQQSREGEARRVIERALRRIQERTRTLPKAYEDAYYEQPVHLAALHRLRDLDGDMPELFVEHLGGAAPIAPEPQRGQIIAVARDILDGSTSLREQQKRLEHECIKYALRKTDGNITHAAELLKLNRSRLSQIINADDELSCIKERLKG